MKRLLGIAAAIGVTVWNGAAQDPAAAEAKLREAKAKLEKMVTEAQVLSVESGVMGQTVKNAPYSADEIRETTQTLGDGTRIHSESKTSVYRDSEGRVRRETPDEISILDPTTGANYVLHPKTMTGRKMTLNMLRTGPVSDAEFKGQIVTFRTTTDSQGETRTITSPQGGTQAALENVLREQAATMDVAKAKMAMAVMAPQMEPDGNPTSKKETLAAQMIEGVNAEGVRVTRTIEQGAIGNDRPIQSIVERWYSQELQTNVLTRRSDPRTGENVVKLTNIHRGEQSPVLFEVPPGYNLSGK
jgi:hypothetical protein